MIILQKTLDYIKIKLEKLTYFLKFIYVAYLGISMLN